MDLNRRNLLDLQIREAQTTEAMRLFLWDTAVAGMNGEDVTRSPYLTGIWRGLGSLATFANGHQGLREQIDTCGFQLAPLLAAVYARLGSPTATQLELRDVPGFDR